jgi:NADH-quinone oxidoreductase subunit N
VWGSLGAYFQGNIKRLLAWSTMAHAGYMLVGMTAVISPAVIARSGAGLGSLVLESPAAEGLLLYMFLFLFMNAGAFVTAAAIAQRLTGPADAGMSLGVDRMTPAAPPAASTSVGTGEDIAQYAGLSRRAPILAATMLAFLLSLAGVPLTIGFAGRMKLFATLFETGSWLGWVGIAVIGVSSIICAFSYFRVIRAMYLVESESPRLIEIAPVTVVALVLLIPTVILFAGYGWVEEQAERHAEMAWSGRNPSPAASVDVVLRPLNRDGLP